MYSLLVIITPFRSCILTLELLPSCPSIAALAPTQFLSSFSCSSFLSPPYVCAPSYVVDLHLSEHCTRAIQQETTPTMWPLVALSLTMRHPQGTPAAAVMADAAAASTADDAAAGPTMWQQHGSSIEKAVGLLQQLSEV